MDEMKKTKYILVILCIGMIGFSLVGCDPNFQYQYTGSYSEEFANFDWTVSSGLSSEEHANEMKKKSDEYSDLGDSPNYETKDLMLPNGTTVPVFVDADKAFEQGTKDFADVFSAIRSWQGILLTISKSNYTAYLQLIHELPTADYASNRRRVQAQHFLAIYDLNRKYT